MLTQSAYGVTLSPDGLTLPDFSINPTHDYNEAPSTSSGFDWFGAVNQGLDTYGKVVSIIDKAKGTTLAQPVTIPAVNSPATANDQPLTIGSSVASFPERMASKFGVGLNVVWGIILVVGAVVVWGGFRLIKKIFKG